MSDEEEGYIYDMRGRGREEEISIVILGVEGGVFFYEDEMPI